MHRIFLKGVRIADPHSDHNGETADIRIEDGIIRQIAATGDLTPEESDQVFDEAGTWVSPGWIDGCVYLSDPGREHIEDLHALGKAALAGGLTGILCYPNTNPVVDNSQMVHSLTARAASMPVKAYFLGNISHRAQGKELAEVYDMHRAGAKAFTDGRHPLQSAGLMVRAFQYLKAFNGLVVTRPDDTSLSDDGQMNEGIVSTQLGMKGIPELAESAMASRMLQLLDYSKGKVHFQPLSSPLAIRLIQDARAENELSMGLSIAHLALKDQDVEAFDTNYKVYPPLRSSEQQKALIKAIQDGWIEVLCSAHQAQGPEEKQVEFGLAEEGMLGLQTFFALANEHLVEPGHISMDKLIDLICHQPRRIFGLPAREIKTGAVAELSLFQPGRSWVFDERFLFSRAKNSPFLGKTLRGKPLGICLEGELRIQSLNL